ncbi:MAG TPA: carboxymuconolactone decarboxylase family protein [Anaerolineaceae bacterium]|nr:carboxymuconolactone decarboxylase family protein [Anaerolineaceae bacterium]
MSTAFIAPPKRIPIWLKIGLWITKRVTGKELLPPRLLAWYPKAAFSSGVMEGLVAHSDRNMSVRLLKLVRMQASFSAACPFCIDMNSQRFSEYNINTDELAAIQGLRPIEEVASFSERERLALRYVRQISLTPLIFSDDLMQSIKESFNEREIVILASTAAQVNYWARLIQALGVPPEGFMEPGEWPEMA